MLERGNSDVFDYDYDLGECNYEKFRSNDHLLVFKAESYGSSDGWLMNFAMVFFEDGSYYNCINLEDKWLYPDNSYKIICTKMRSEYF